VFTPTEARHWRPKASRVNYRDLAMADRVEQSAREVESPIFDGWVMGSTREAAVAVKIFRSLQLLAKQVPAE
jgi:hypothetical protein